MSYLKTLEGSCHALHKSTSEGILPRFTSYAFQKPSIIIDQKITFTDIPSQDCHMNQHTYKHQSHPKRWPVHERVTRINSGCQRQKYTQQWICKDKMIDIYKLQNDNLRQQNTFLLQQLRKYQKKQTKLYHHIDQLSSQLHNYREPTNTYRSSHKPQHSTRSDLKERISVTVKANTNPLNNTQQSNTFNSTQNSNAFKKSYILEQQHQQQQSQHQMYNLLENMNRQFCKVMDECARQTNQNRKNALRESLANLANQMKQVRKSFKMS